MHARRIPSFVKYVYFAVLLMATAVGAWRAYPYLEQQRMVRASPLAVHVYYHPFVSAMKDTAIDRGVSSIDKFFSQDIFDQAVAEIMQRQPAPLAKGADGGAWSQALASDLTASLNNYMARRYRDSLERLDVSSQAKGLVLVRIENISGAPVEDFRVEVNGGQLFMEGPAPTVKLRSLGARAMRIPAIAPGEKADLFVLTTEAIGGSIAPHVLVSSKGQPFPIVMHAQDEPAGAMLKAAAWVAFGTLYMALILTGLGLKALSLMGVRFGVLVTEKSAPTAAPASSVSPSLAPAQSTPAAPETWQRPQAH